MVYLGVAVVVYAPATEVCAVPFATVISFAVFLSAGTEVKLSVSVLAFAVGPAAALVSRKYHLVAIIHNRRFTFSASSVMAILSSGSMTKI